MLGGARSCIIGPPPMGNIARAGRMATQARRRTSTRRHRGGPPPRLEPDADIAEHVPETRESLTRILGNDKAGPCGWRSYRVTRAEKARPRGSSIGPSRRPGYARVCGTAASTPELKQGGANRSQSVPLSGKGGDVTPSLTA